MAALPEGTPAVDGREASGDGNDGRRLDRLSPLFHDLLAWDLVYQEESGEFVLRPDVQRRLAETAAKAPRFAADVYVGRHCERCGVIGITRLTEGMRLCDLCASYLQSPADDDDPPPTVDVKRRRRGSRSRRYRAAG